MKKKEIQAFEIDQLLAAIHFRYGYDFRNYARASLTRRILNRVNMSGLGSVSEMIPGILHDTCFFEQFLRDMSITVTGMFRNPGVFKEIRNSVFTWLETYSRINIWVAGCATGEEAYSTAILLNEESLLDRSRIYATDFNNRALAIAQRGIYPAEKIKGVSGNYLAAGGRGDFADYYRAGRDSAAMDPSLQKHITFANHNLIKDQVFAEMHLILCRNVLIYFNKKLTGRVLRLLSDSLVHSGFLVLGSKESLEFTSVADTFGMHCKKNRIYRKGNRHPKKGDSGDRPRT